jgi:hypothetical protein
MQQRDEGHPGPAGQVVCGIDDLAAALTGKPLLSAEGATAFVAERWPALGLWNDRFSRHLSEQL